MCLSVYCFDRSVRFQVCCPLRELGCMWVDELRTLDQHLNATTQLERQLEGCPFTSVKYIHCIRRHVIADHQNVCCLKRPYTCEYCEEYESTFEGVTNHWPAWAECMCYLLSCPNSCNPSGSGVERQSLEHHVKEECPLTVVECDFHYAGCGVRLPRKDMAYHMKEESLVHNSLLAAEKRGYPNMQLLERYDQMQQLMQQNTKLSNWIHQQERAYQELEKEVTQTKNTLKQQHQAHRELAEKVTYALDQQEEANKELVEELTQTKDAQQQQ